MPYYGPTIDFGTANNNPTDYMHSTIHTVTHTNDMQELNVDISPLTTIYTPPASCTSRFLIGGEPYGNNGATYNVYSFDNGNDPLYKACQPRDPAPVVYSPGVCPDGQTMAEVTAHRTTGTDGAVENYWQASCCPRSLSFGARLSGRCRSSHETPFRAFAPMTRSASDGTGSTTVYEYVTSSLISGSSSGGAPVYSSSTVVNMTMQTGGYVVANPIVVAWQEKDLASFPDEYASSLAGKIGVTLTASPKASSGIPGPTSSSSSAASEESGSGKGLALGAKLGIVFGCLVAFALLCGLIILAIRSRKKKISRGAGSENELIVREELDGQEKTGGGYAKHAQPLEVWGSEGAAPVELPGTERLPPELDTGTTAVGSAQGGVDNGKAGGGKFGV